MATIKCDQCGTEFDKSDAEIKRSNHNFCNHKCFSIWKSENVVGENHPLFDRVKVVCNQCGKDVYQPKNQIKKSNHHFCGRACFGVWASKNRVYSERFYFRGGSKIVNCAYCGKETKRFLSKIKKHKDFYCSKECLSKGHALNFKGKLCGEKNPMFGTHHSAEWRTKHSEFLKGRYCGENNPLWGTHLSEERKKKMSERNKGEGNPMYGKTGILSPMYGKHGKDHPAYINGKGYEPYTPDFNERLKEKIKERDNHCCMLCHMNEEDLKLLGRYLVEHHIDYDKKNSFPQNLITLCNICHNMTNTNREIWTLHFHELLKKLYNYQYTENQKIILDFKEV